MVRGVVCAVCLGRVELKGMSGEQAHGQLITTVASFQIMNNACGCDCCAVLWGAVPLRVVQCHECRCAARVELWCTVEGARLGTLVLVVKGGRWRKLQYRTAALPPPAPDRVCLTAQPGPPSFGAWPSIVAHVLRCAGAGTLDALPPPCSEMCLEISPAADIGTVLTRSSFRFSQSFA